MLITSPRTLTHLQDAGYKFFSVSNKNKADRLAMLKVSSRYSRVFKLVRPT